MKQTIVDVVSGSLTYSGEANLWRATSDPFWTIKKISVSWNVTTTAYPCWPSRIPTDEDIFVWDRRAEYTYSLTPDTSAPTLTTVTIASDNSDTTKAKVGDTVTISITASEALSTISATIAGHTATIADTGTNTYTASYVMDSGDTTWAVTFTIDFADVVWRSGTQVTATTDLSAVTFDKTAPVGTLEYSIDAGSNYYTTLSVKNVDTLRIRATFSEDLLDSPVVKLAIDNAVLSATNMTKTSASVYYYDLNVPAWDIATATCSLSVGTDASGNVVTSAPVNATFSIDNTAPAISSSARNTNTQITVTLSQLALASTITKANDGGFIVTETGWVATYAVSAIAPGATNDLVVLTVANMGVSAKEGVTVTYTAGGNGTVSDLVWNTMATDAVGAAITAWDTTAPTMASGERLSNTVLRITLSEDADDATITAANDWWFVVYETGTPATTYAVSAIAKSGSDSSKIELTIADATASAAIGLTITYVAWGNGVVADVAGNTMATDAVWVLVASWA